MQVLRPRPGRTLRTLARRLKAVTPPPSYTRKVTYSLNVCLLGLGLFVLGSRPQELPAVYLLFIAVAAPVGASCFHTPSLLLRVEK